MRGTKIWEPDLLYNSECSRVSLSFCCFSFHLSEAGIIGVFHRIEHVEFFTLFKAYFLHFFFFFFTFLYFVWVRVCHCIHVEVLLQLSRIGSPLHPPGSEDVMLGGEHLLSHFTDLFYYFWF